MAQEKEYILGTDEAELTRLAIQHRIWSDAAAGAWKRAGVMPGSKVLDLGCGPGHATFDLAQLVTSAGSVLGVDESERFTSYLNNQAKLRDILQVKAEIANAENLTATLKENSFDVVYTRWLLCWLKHPEKAIAGVAKVLKPGGRFVIHDYFNWKSMSAAPRSKAIDKMVAAAVESFNDGGGDIDIAARIPKMLNDAGFEVKHLELHARVARGGGEDGTMAWLVTWWHQYAPKLLQMGRLTKDECTSALTEIDLVAADANRFFVCPPVYEFIATRK